MSFISHRFTILNICKLKIVSKGLNFSDILSMILNAHGEGGYKQDGDCDEINDLVLHRDKNGGHV